MAAQALGVGLKRSVNPPKVHSSAVRKTLESNLSMSGKIIRQIRSEKQPMQLRLQRYSYRFAEQVDDNNRIIRTEYFTSHPLHLSPQRARRKAKEKDSDLISKPNKIETHLRRLGRQRATGIVQFTFSELKWVR